MTWPLGTISCLLCTTERIDLRLIFFAAPSSTPTNNPEPSYVGPMDTYAVVEIGGHQLVVEEGRWYTVNRLEVGETERQHLFMSALLVKSNYGFLIGSSSLMICMLSVCRASNLMLSAYFFCRHQ